MSHRATLVLATAALVVAALAGVAARGATQPHHEPAQVTSQCDLPVSQRTGGWLCPGTSGTGATDR